MRNIWAILGAPDPEMAYIETLLRQSGIQTAYAAVAGTAPTRVRPDQAYTGRIVAVAADGTIVPIPRHATVVVIECDYPADNRIVIDHHRPGDPGYGRSPAEFLPASSLGQTISLLARLDVLPWPTVPDQGATVGDFSFKEQWHIGRHSGASVVPLEFVLAAAADHCLAAAYRGECPGVDPDALMRWRIASRSSFQNRSADAVLADVEAARQAIRDAPALNLGQGQVAADLRGRHIPELPEASAREGRCIVANGLPLADGRVKVICQSGSADQIRAFMAWAKAQGLVGVYGDPERGFAGAYVAP